MFEEGPIRFDHRGLGGFITGALRDALLQGEKPAFEDVLLVIEEAIGVELHANVGMLLEFLQDGPGGTRRHGLQSKQDPLKIPWRVLVQAADERLGNRAGAEKRGATSRLAAGLNFHQAYLLRRFLRVV